jgi:hypothetical protein
MLASSRSPGAGCRARVAACAPQWLDVTPGGAARALGVDYLGQHFFDCLDEAGDVVRAGFGIDA